MPTPSGVWLVDDVQPVAAFVAAVGTVGGGGRLRLVDWVGTRPAPPGSPRTVLADGEGLVVQDGADAPVVRVAANGDVTVHQAPALELRAAHGGDLWLSGGAMVTVPARVFGQPSPPPLPLGKGLIVVVHADGSRRQVTVDHPVAALTATPAGLVITVSEQPVSIDRSGYTSHSHPTSTVLLGWEDRSPRLRIEDLPAAPEPRRPTRHWAWHDQDPDWLRDFAVDGLGLLWSAGWAAPSGSGPDRPLLVTGHDPDTLTEQTRVPLGVGEVRDVAVVGDEVWLAVSRGRSVDAVRPVEVVAVSAAGDTRVVLGADSVDITDRCRGLIAQDEDIRTGYPARQRDELGDLQAFWGYPGRPRTPVADGVIDAVVSVQGTWPHTVLQITCRHPSRAGLLLRRRIPLFDEFGRPTEPEYTAVYLMEDLDTGWLPPAGDAHHGILDI